MTEEDWRKRLEEQRKSSSDQHNAHAVQFGKIEQALADNRVERLEQHETVLAINAEQNAKIDTLEAELLSVKTTVAKVNADGEKMQADVAKLLEINIRQDEAVNERKRLAAAVGAWIKFVGVIVGAIVSIIAFARLVWEFAKTHRP